MSQNYDDGHEYPTGRRDPTPLNDRVDPDVMSEQQPKSEYQAAGYAPPDRMYSTIEAIEELTDEDWIGEITHCPRCGSQHPIREGCENCNRELLAEAMSAESTVKVCLCGSTKFTQIRNSAGRSLWQEMNLRETLAGRIVLTIGCDMRSDNDLFGKLSEEAAAEIKARLDQLHLRKIDLADQVLILNYEGYLGDSTRRELEYARANGKSIRWLEPTSEALPGEIIELYTFMPVQLDPYSSPARENLAL